MVTPQIVIWRKDMERIYVYTEMIDEYIYRNRT